MERDEQRTLAAQLYNECWPLLEATDRSADDDARLLTNAFASRHHWLAVGGTEQWIVSDWMVSRAAAASGFGELSVFFAVRAYDTARTSDVPDWLVASTAEGVARAFDARGDRAQRERWRAVAAELVAAIAHDESRTLIGEQLASVPG